MDRLSFSAIAEAWKKMVSDPIKRDHMKTSAPSLSNPEAIHFKLLDEDDEMMEIRIYGFDAASTDANGVPIIRRMIQNWIKKISMSVQIKDSIEPDLVLVVSKHTMFTEATITVFRRDPKTNTVKRAYKCVGGRKDGRKVQDPDQCMQVPDVDKKINLAITKRAKYGQSAKNRTKTKLTNIVSRKVRKANQRLKTARGM